MTVTTNGNGNGDSDGGAYQMLGLVLITNKHIGRIEKPKMSDGRTCFVVTAVLLMVLSAVAGDNWDTATATFYGDMSGSETMMGACGYGNLFDQGYGLETTALSKALFNDGLTCGACYQIQCYNDPQWCASGASIIDTATNLCPPNSTGGWCNPPRKHFDLSMPMFVKLVKDYHVEIIPVQYRRVPCVKKGGMKFQLQGNPNWLLVLVYNVGGAGDVKAVSVKGSSTGWIQMSRNWGQNWQTGVGMQGQSLSFQVTASDGRMVQSDNVVPANWQYGKSFEGRQF